MTIQVIGQSFDVGESLTDHVKDLLDRKTGKYNQELISANVVFSEAPHKKVSVSVHIHLKIKEFMAKSEGIDAYSVFNHAMEDIETQLTKTLEKTKSHNHN